MGSPDSLGDSNGAQNDEGKNNEITIEEAKATADRVKALGEDALKKFESPDLLTIIIKELCRKVVGNRKQLGLIFLVAASTQLPPEERVSLKLRGISTGGKSFAWSTVAQHIPDKWFTDLTRFTRAVLEDDIKSVGVYGGELDKNEDQRLTEAIKQYSEDGMRVLKKQFSKEQKGYVEHRIVKDRGVVIYSTTAGGGDEEEDNRFLSITLDSDLSIWEEVNTTTLKRQGNLDALVDDFINKINDSWIEVGLNQLKIYDIIYIPFSECISVKSNSARTQRDLKRLISLIKASAWVYQHQRPKIKKDGLDILFALPEDFFWAVWLSHGAFKQSLTHVDQRLSETYDTICALHEEIGAWESIDDAPGYCWIKRSYLQKVMNINWSGTIKEYTEVLEKMGKIALHVGRGGSRTYVALENHSERMITKENYHPLFRFSIETQYKNILDNVKKNNYKMYSTFGLTIGRPVVYPWLMSQAKELETTGNHVLTTGKPRVKPRVKNDNNNNTLSNYTIPDNSFTRGLNSTSHIATSKNDDKNKEGVYAGGEKPRVKNHGSNFPSKNIPKPKIEELQIFADRINRDDPTAGVKVIDGSLSWAKNRKDDNGAKDKKNEEPDTT